jgi:hypothetical protein
LQASTRSSLRRSRSTVGSRRVVALRDVSAETFWRVCFDRSAKHVGFRADCVEKVG